MSTKQPTPQEQVVQQMPLEQIVTNENQPRKSFYQDTLEELAASIKERGVLEPIVVRPFKGPDRSSGQVPDRHG